MKYIFGFVDTKRYTLLKATHPNLRVYLDDKDITDNCRWANDETGEAEVLVISYTAGSIGVDIRRKLLHGKVEFAEARASTLWTCSVCSREADIGHPCWWCGCKQQ